MKYETIVFHLFDRYSFKRCCFPEAGKCSLYSHRQHKCLLNMVFWCRYNIDYLNHAWRNDRQRKDCCNIYLEIYINVL